MEAIDDCCAKRQFMKDMKIVHMYCLQPCCFI